MYSTPILEKTIFIQDAVTKKCQIIKYNLPIHLPIIDLKPLFNQYVQNYQNKLFRIFNPQVNEYIPISMISIQSYVIPICYFQLNTIMFQYFYSSNFHKMQENLEHIKIGKSKSINQSIFPFNNQKDLNLKKQRSKERSIEESIELVKQWRQLQTKLIKGRRLSLKQTADQMGVSKKSLDDYFYQLRIGQYYGFDFNQNRTKKIGFLRNFIKKKQQESRKKLSAKKMPKKLKIIETFQSMPKEINNEKVLGKKDHIFPKNDDFPLIKQQYEQPPQVLNVSTQKQFDQKQKQIFSDKGFFWGNPLDSVSQQIMNNCEKKYFDDFKSINPDFDPFIRLGRLSQQQNSFNSLILF